MSDSKKTIMLKRSDIWFIDAYPYTTEANKEKLKSLSIDINEFYEFALKLSRCTHIDHLSVVFVIYVIMLIAPFAFFGIAYVYNEYLAVSISLGVLEVVFLIFALCYVYLPFQLIMYKRAQYLIEQENLKSCKQGIRYSLSTTVFNY